MNNGGEEVIKIKGRKKTARHIEAIIYALSRPETRVIHVEGTGNAIEKIIEILNFLHEFAMPLTQNLKIGTMTVKEYFEKKTSKGRILRIPIYRLTIEKTEKFNEKELEPVCPDGYKHIKVSSKKTFHHYVNAFALAVNTKEGKGICLDGAGLAIENVLKTIEFLEKNAKGIMEAVKLEKICIGNGVAPTGEKYGRLMFVYSIKEPPFEVLG